ncbi:glycosyltransferase family 4 protein [Acuticoccus sp. M5D2P5]|nr:glycosyltransferase family 4 protein [Acuticoccus kalidii]MCF3934134.1 glycosyltransferase family 4 protein [Acuticoccus kalidii]
MTDRGHQYDYPPVVDLSIAEEDLHSYEAAARHLNSGRFDIVSLQHEFGIFGGVDGDNILDLIDDLRRPLVTTMHTILSSPGLHQRYVTERIAGSSERVIVMSEKGAWMLAERYRVDPQKIDVIAHGIPDVPIVAPDIIKAKRGFIGRTVILTFGLLSPNKGIEVMIDAMPAVLKSYPDALYIVLGATHPNLLRTDGENYRTGLVGRVDKLGITSNVLFIDQFIERRDLLEYIAMCDLYVTPYLSEEQMTSGTLAYSFGLGRPIVSTPYWHATELLAGGRGELVPFGDSKATGDAITALLANPARCRAISQRNYSESRSMTWRCVGEQYVDVFADVLGGRTGRREARPAAALNAA